MIDWQSLTLTTGPRCHAVPRRLHARAPGHHTELGNPLIDIG